MCYELNTLAHLHTPKTAAWHGIYKNYSVIVKPTLDISKDNGLNVSVCLLLFMIRAGKYNGVAIVNI